MEVVYGIGSYCCGSPSCVAVGSFDGLHIGHRKILGRLIEIAQQRGLRSVAVTFDPHPRQVLAPESRVSFVLSRSEKIEAFRSVGIDCLVVHPFSADLASLSGERFLNEMLCRRLGMRYLVKGFNNHFGCDRLSDAAAIRRIGEESGFLVEEVDAVLSDGAQASSTMLRRLLADGDVRRAREILGRLFPITGIVGHGRMIGRSIGFPTANIELDDDSKIIPAAGVYAALAEADAAMWPAMLNIGSNPTVNGDCSRLLLEAHLIGYKGNLYGQSVRLYLAERLRAEQKFPSLESLRLQLEVDMAESLAICCREFPQIAEGSRGL